MRQTVVNRQTLSKQSAFYGLTGFEEAFKNGDLHLWRLA